MEIYRKVTNQTIFISALFSDNWGVESIEWLVDGIIEQSNASIGDAVSSSFTFSFDSNYQAGEHNIEFIVTDKSGQKSSDSVKVILSDLSPPVFDNYVNQISVSVGEPITFEISAYDEESDEIQYSWIFNEGTEDETQLYGRLIQYDFQTTGAQRVLCIAENSAGLSSQAEIIVTVMESESENKSLNPFFILIILILFLIIISIIAYIFFRRRILIRTEELSQKKEEPAEEIKPPSVEEQKQMWAQTSPNLYISNDNNIVDISDVDLEGLLEDAQTSPSKSFTSEDNLLSDLIDDISDSKPANNVTEKVSDRVIKKNCSSCNLLFSVELPEGIDSARTACPKCGSIEDVNLG